MEDTTIAVLNAVKAVTQKPSALGIGAKHILESFCSRFSAQLKFFNGHTIVLLSLARF